MSAFIEFVAALFLLIGAFFALVGSIGLVRLPDFFTRLHAPTKSGTLGIGAVMIASMVLPLAYGSLPGFAELLLTFFVFITAPVSANMLALAALRKIDYKAE
tara:strand:- start:127 stop:432 length:306 start_codon:yes stop_codon:yes gene_type:complete